MGQHMRNKHETQNAAHPLGDDEEEWHRRHIRNCAVWAAKDSSLDGRLAKELVPDSNEERAYYVRFCEREFAAGRKVAWQFQ